MIKKSIFFIGIGAIILSVGFGIYLGINVLNQKRVAEAKRLKMDYQIDHLSSTLLKGVILEPSRGNIEETIKIFLKAGDYNSAEALNVFIRDKDFNYTIAESALFNLHLRTAKEYIDRLPNDSKAIEINNLYDWMLYGDKIAKAKNPETDAGKFSQMVEMGDFRAFELDNYLYDAITKNDIVSTSSLISRLKLSQLFNNHQLNEAAIYFLNSDLECNTDAYLYKSKLYSELNKHGEALRTVEAGLDCDAANLKLLRSAINYTKLLNNESKYQLYTSRINQLKMQR